MLELKVLCSIIPLVSLIDITSTAFFDIIINYFLRKYFTLNAITNHPTIV